MPGHDMIVIGASVGGVEALSRLVGQFPEDLPATICVVQHTMASALGRMAKILDRAGPLPATQARAGNPVEIAVSRQNRTRTGTNP